jgi:serine/threonine-protein kinase
VVQSLKSGEPQTLIDHASDARYVPTGHIVYASGGTLFAVAFDTKGLKLTGKRVRVVEGIRRSTGAAVEYSFSSNGTLIYVPGPVSTTAEQFVLALMDRQGVIVPLKVPARTYAFPRISPDGKSVAVEIDDEKLSDIWIYELSGTKSPRQLTVGGANHYPVWSADGVRVAFQSDRDGDLGIFWQRGDGTGIAERLTKPEQGVAHIPDSWSKEDDRLSFTAVKGSEAAIWILSLKDRKTSAFAQEPSMFIARSSFSPDGRWIAYQSSESGKRNLRLWVQPFPATGEKHPIAAGGQPFWSPDGNELFFNAGTGGMVSKVIITTRPTFSPGEEIPVAQGEVANASSLRFPRNADITPDGTLIGLIPAETTLSGSILAPQIQVVLNWFEELKQRVPVH